MNSTRDDRAWRRIAIGSFLTLLCVTVAWNAAAYAIDASGLDRGDSWPMIFGSVIVTVLYGTTPLVLSLIAAAAVALGAPGVARPGAWCGAALDAVCSAGLVIGAGTLVGGSPAEAAFAVVTALVALVLLQPGWLCIRQASNERARPEGHVQVA